LKNTIIFKKILIFFIITLSLIVLISSLFSCTLSKKSLSSTNSSEMTKGLNVEIEIKEGMSLTQVADLLAQKGIIDNSLLFKIYAQQKGIEKKIIPGTYNLKTGSDYDEVIKVISAGPPIVSFKLVIPEGFTVNQIVSRLIEDLPFIKETDIKDALNVGNYNYDFLKDNNKVVQNLEGFLFPKTYEVLQQYTAQNIIEMFLSQYQFETSNLDYSFAIKNNFSAYDILKVASMIEREAYLPEERPLISAVIYNRLKLKMPLGIDATLSYFLNKWDEPLTESDLKTDTPYNTRLYEGLPPTPICNPGLDSIKAALNPANVDYLYYVVTDPVSHKHTFSKTLKEHNAIVNSTTSTTK